VEVSFGDEALNEIERDPHAKTRYDHKIVRAFRKVMNFIRSAGREADLYAHPGLNFEKLKGDLAGFHSLRLNDQWRLIVELRSGNPKTCIHVMEIKDYH